MNTSEQHKATRGSCLLDIFLRPVVGLLGLLTVGGSLQNNRGQPRLVPAKVGKMSFKQKRIIKFRPRIKLDHNFSMERWGGKNNVVVTKKNYFDLF